MSHSELHNPWTKVSSKPVYDNPWISIREDQIINPAGNKGIYGVVSFKNKAIGVVPVDDEGYLYLVGQFRYTLDAYSWEIPEGGGPQGEEPIETAKRELQEETGLIAHEWTDLGSIHTSNSVTDEVGYLFMARKLVQGESAPEETEELNVRRVHLKEAVEMVMNSTITDSLSIAGILKAARILGL